MLINVSDPIFQTAVFSILFFVAIFVTVRRRHVDFEISVSLSNELKGVAILMIILAHTGYALSVNTRFLFPLSIFAGVGVNLFLFLSGFGLTKSALKTKLPCLKFYKKRFTNIYLPMWIVVSILLILDLVLLNRTYPLSEIINSYFGYFPVADIYTNLNSPLWYFSFIVFYYLIFPLLFSRKFPLLSIAVVILISLFVVKLTLPVSPDVLNLYKLHTIAFPMGMLFAVYSSKIVDIINNLKPLVRFLMILTLTYIFVYTAINSGVGKGSMTEQKLSLITTSALVLIFILKKFQSRFLILIGIYSYEIYLIQWPIMYRHDFLYKFLPASLATFAYILSFIFLAYLLKKIEKTIHFVVKFLARSRLI